MKKRPIIGITVSLDHGQIIRPGQDYSYVRRTYARAVQKAGGHPVLLSTDIDPEAVAEICDGVVISGGDDIPPAWYGEALTDKTRLESSERLDWDRRLLDAYLKTAKPLLGVCYGMQLMNVHFGGSLFQDIQSVRQSAVDHGGGGKVALHEVDIMDGSMLSAVLGPRATVASMHHQAVDRLAPGFRVSATAADGIIEAVERGSLLGVEWHPESDATGEAVYALLVERAGLSNRSRP